MRKKRKKMSIEKELKQGGVPDEKKSTKTHVTKFVCKRCGGDQKKWSTKNSDWYCNTCGLFWNPIPITTHSQP
ncbi:MAG: hypothetical protein ACKO96_48515 [Flammeovirgaceae bacterium]